MVWSPEKMFELEAGSSNITMTFTNAQILHLTSLHLDRLQGNRDKTWTWKTRMADSMKAIQEWPLRHKKQLLFLIKSAIGVVTKAVL